jgi:hypothetical protein
MGFFNIAIVSGIEARLLAATKSNQATTADVMIAYTTLSALSLGKWVQRLFVFTPITEGRLFSTEQQATSTSQYFRTNYANAILEMQCMAGEPSLSTF